MPSTWCQTTLNYAGEVDAVPVTVTVANGREAAIEFETSGFTLLEHASAVTNWHDPDQVAAIHEPEIATLARQFTGCDHTVVYPALVRSPAAAAKTDDHAPIEFVHSDFTDDYLAMVREDGRAYRAFLDPLLDRCGLTLEDVRTARRVMLVQFWRNIGPIQPDRPLAFCDAATVPRDETGTMLVDDYGGERLEFETMFIRPPADPTTHHWYTFPRMRANEVVAFRTYDSRCAEENRPFWTPHSAFVDPVAGADAPPRESVEMRALCLWQRAS